MGACGRPPFEPVRQGIRALQKWAPVGSPSSQCARVSELFRNGRLRPATLQASAPGHTGHARATPAPCQRHARATPSQKIL
eukprot:gene12643-biopygen6461